MNRLTPVQPTGAHAWIRNHVLGVVAIFIALNGTAVAAQVVENPGAKAPATASADAKAKAAASLTKQIKALKRRLAALEAKAGLAGPQGPQGPQGPSGPSTGGAGGDLTGTYPNPTIAGGAVTIPKLSFDPATQAELNALATPGTINQGANPVDWTKLKGVPAGLADGTDDGGPPTGAAGAGGGALAGTYPNPTLDVSGGPCPNGQELDDVTAQAALSCSPGVYSDPNSNVAAGPTSFPALTTGFSNSALGDGALSSNTTASNNSAVGASTLTSNTTGQGNSALGASALQSNTTGFGNSAVGSFALSANTTGLANSALGSIALATNTTGEDNSALGDAALRFNTIGSRNSALGSEALTSNTTGGGNSAVGRRALQDNTASNNSALGDAALRFNTTGTGNTALGQSAGSALTTGSNNIDIGAGVTGADGESNTIRIGNEGTQTTTFLAGVDGATTGGASSPVLVDANGELGTTASSRRFKTDIQPLGPSLEGLMKLKPVSFRYKDGGAGGALQFGLLAEQVANVYPNLVVNGEDGLPSSVAYHELPALLLAKIQAQQRQIDWLMRHQAGR
jgi:endosialidase-like protein